MNRGFTLTELMIVLAIIGIFGAIVLGAINGSYSPGSISYGWNGMTEERCITGYKHVVGERGQARQVLNENGHGIRCN